VDTAAPDVAFVCATTSSHREWVEQFAGKGVHLIVEKPMASSLADADAMVAAADEAGVVLTLNWPLAWVPAHRTAKRLVTEGAIGRVEQVHFYDGNRASSTTPTARPSSTRRSRTKRTAAGTTPPPAAAVSGTTWGTARPSVRGISTESCLPRSRRSSTYPRACTWTSRPSPSPRTRRGSRSSRSVGEPIPIRGRFSRRLPLDAIAPEDHDALSNLIAHLRTGRALDGPLTPAISHTGQAIVEATARSAESGRTESLDA
jgi:hypothetical protein